MDVLHLTNEWPYLFEPVGINIREKFDSAITSKGARILKWMEEEPCKNVRRIRQKLVKASFSVDNTNGEVAAMICAVVVYLQKKELLYISPRLVP